MGGQMNSAPPVNSSAFRMGGMGGQMGGPSPPQHFSPPTHHQQQPPSNQHQQQGGGGAPGGQKSGGRPNVIEGVQRLLESVHNEPDGPQNGPPIGEHVEDERSVVEDAEKSDQSEDSSSWKCPKPLVVELPEPRDEDDGLAERMIPKTLQLQRERELGPRFAAPNSFEFIGMEWKELYEVERQRRAQAEEELKEARRRLEADMELAYQDCKAQMLREDIQRRQQELERLEAARRDRMNQNTAMGRPPMGSVSAFQQGPPNFGMGGQMNSAPPVNSSAFGMGGMGGQMGGPPPPQHFSPPTHHQQQPPSNQQQQQGGGGAPGGQQSGGRPNVIEGVQRLLESVHNEPDGPQNGPPIGEHVEDERSVVEDAEKSDQSEDSSSWKCPKPLVVELPEPRDEDDGLAERMIPKTLQLQRERELGPRFAAPNSFEFIGMEWKELYEVERQRRAQAEEELKEARRRLEADMELAYQDCKAQMLREDIQRRQQELERLEAARRDRMNQNTAMGRPPMGSVSAFQQGPPNFGMGGQMNSAPPVNSSAFGMGGMGGQMGGPPPPQHFSPPTHHQQQPPSNQQQQQGGGGAPGGQQSGGRPNVFEGVQRLLESVHNEPDGPQNGPPIGGGFNGWQWFLKRSRWIWTRRTPSRVRTERTQ